MLIAEYCMGALFLLHEFTLVKFWQYLSTKIQTVLRILKFDAFLL